MPVLITCLAIALIVFLIAGPVWLVLRVLGQRGHGRAVLRWAGLSYVVAAPLFLFILLPLLIAYLISHASTRPMDMDLPENPGSYGRSWEDAEFVSQDGTVIRGWYLPGEEGQTPFVFGHGLFRERHEVLERACTLNARGYPGLVFDFRGHGRSQKAPVTLGYKERLDVQAAAAYLSSRTGAPRVAFCGVSMGAVAALLAAADRPNVAAALVADSPFSTLEETVRRHVSLFLGLPEFPFVPLFVWNLSRLGHFPSQSHDSLQAAAQLASFPTLLIYGAEDQRMPGPTAAELYDAVAGTRKELVVVEGAGHGAAFREAPDLYVGAVERFLNPEAPLRSDSANAAAGHPAPANSRP